MNFHTFVFHNMPQIPFKKERNIMRTISEQWETFFSSFCWFHSDDRKWWARNSIKHKVVNHVKDCHNYLRHLFLFCNSAYHLTHGEDEVKVFLYTFLFLQLQITLFFWNEIWILWILQLPAFHSRRHGKKWLWCCQIALFISVG